MMNRTAIQVVVVLFFGLVALGFYRGWFAVSSRSRDARSNKVNVNLTMDRDKMQEDAETVKNKAAALAGEVSEEVRGTAQGLNKK
jgi:hypothetical protein